MAGISKHSAGVGAAALENATGKSPDEWLAILDAQDATSWTHTAIARWVFEHYDEVDGWWAQSITVMYEQERGMRMPGQMPDGTFSVSGTRSVPGDQQEALDRAIAAFSEQLGAPRRVARDATYPSASWQNARGENLLVRIGPTRNGKSSITMTHSRIPDAEAAGTAKKAIADTLEELVG